MQGYKQKTEALFDQPRRKLYSLRSLTSHNLPYGTVSLNKNSFDKLEKSLNRDNKLEEQPVAEPIAVIPGFEEQVTEGKLWNYFAAKMQEVASKVEKEKVNCREKQFWVIKQQVANLQSNYAKQTSQIEAIIRDKYKQVHGLFEEIKQERSLKNYTVSAKAKKSKRDLFMMDNTEKLVVLKEQVQTIRNEVLQFELQLGKVTQDAQKLKREWINFLKSILRGGFYLKEGMELVLKEMIAVGFTPNLEDMPDILDETSKRCLIQHYHSLKNNQKIKIEANSQIFQRSRILSQAKQSLSQIARRELVREVYKDTQEFMANLVRQTAWKTSTITLPKIQSSRKEEGESWREYEKKRVSYAYSGEDLVKVKGILFGWKVQSIQ